MNCGGATFIMTIRRSLRARDRSGQRNPGSVHSVKPLANDDPVIGLPIYALPDVLSRLYEWLRAVTPFGIKVYAWAAWSVYSNPWLYVLVGLILYLEHVRPAMETQRVFSRGLGEDFLWFNLDAIFKAVAFPAYIAMLSLAYVRVSGGFKVTWLDQWPFAAKAIVAFLLYDFLQWFQHWTRHKVQVLWQFHLIHHSQREINLFTDLRFHLVEHLVAAGLTFVPLFVLNFSPLQIVGFSVFQLWYARLLHANVRTNFGPLKYVLVSPQNHRIHHSIEPRHQDKNFGLFLTVWDRMFGTLHTNYDEYPATGVAGVDFSPQPGRTLRSSFGSLVTELIYPFRKILARR